MRVHALPWLLAALACARAQPLDIGREKQLFIDQRFIQASDGVALRMNPPVKKGAVLRGDRPWDAGWVTGAGTVLEEDGRYRMWYTAMPAEGVLGQFRLCYAESNDGITWRKPNLGLFEWRGSRANNILMETNIENAGGIFRDPTASAAERYKMVAILPREKAPNGEAGIYVYTSPDGLRWELHPHRVLPFHPDTVNMAFYDTRLRKYVAYLRKWDKGRKIGRVETGDLLAPWPYDRNAPAGRVWAAERVQPPTTQIPTSFGFDEADPQPSDHYTSAVVQYPWAADAYFMFPSAYQHFPEPPKSKYRNDGPLDIQMAASRDGVVFQRVERAPYIELGLDDEGDAGSMYMHIGMLRVNNRLYQYYGGMRHTHGAYQGYGELWGIGAIFRVEQRLDGFVSVDAGMAGGSFHTPPLRFVGTSLELNMNASAMGQVLVELRDEHGAPIAGYTFADCDVNYRNHLGQKVTWKGKGDVGALQTKPVRLAFRLRAAKLYAFQFVP